MNKIIIEFSAEDRARLDRIAELLEAEAKQAPKNIGAATVAPTVKKDPEPTPKTAPEAPGTTAPQVMPKPEEKPEIVEKPAPTVTLAQIQQKVVQLAAGFNGTKKAAVREIVNAYAAKVSEIPADKWDEVWAKLTALESEN